MQGQEIRLSVRQDSGMTCGPCNAKANALAEPRTQALNDDEHVLSSHDHETISTNDCSTKLVDEVVARMTSRFEHHLKLMIEEEMMEIVSKISRGGAGGWTAAAIADPSRIAGADASDVGEKGASEVNARSQSTKAAEDRCEEVGQTAAQVPIPANPGQNPDVAESSALLTKLEKKKTAMLRERGDQKKRAQLFGLAAFRACKGWELDGADRDDTGKTDHQELDELETSCVKSAEQQLSETIDALHPELHESHQQRGFKGFLQSNSFDLIVASFICANSIVMATQLEHQGNETAEIGGYELDSGPWAGAETAFGVLEVIFTIGFVIELCLRIWANGMMYLKPWSNRLDALIVVQAVLDLVLDVVGVGGVPNLSTLRLLRIIKLMRVLRIIRVMRVFRQLRVLTYSIASSGTALLWSITLLFVIQIICSIFITQALQVYLRDEDENPVEQEYVYDRFGTFARAFLTMFELTFVPGAWSGVGRVIIYKVHRVYAAFFLPYCVGITFAIVTIIRAIFLKETLASANSDDDIVVAELAHEKGKTVKKLQGLFSRIDIDNSGDISFEELKVMLEDPVTEAVFSTLEITVREARGFFELIDDGDGRLTFNEFMTGILRLKGGTKNMDLVTCLFENKKILDKIYQVQLSVEKLTDEVLDTQKEVVKTEASQQRQQQWLTNMMQQIQHRH